MRTIECEDCGQPYETKRHNTKYCEVCRTLRSLLFLRNTRYKNKCFSCDRDFLPLDRADVLCGECDFIDGGKRVRGTCRLCAGEDRILVDREIRVCLGCAKPPAGDTETRDVLIKSLLKKQRATREEATHA